MKLNVERKLALFLFFSLGICCYSFSQSGRSGKLYQSFYVGEDGVQYFIKPLKWKNDANSSFEADFTFRYKEGTSNDASVKMTLVEGIKLVKSVKKITISSSTGSVSLDSLSTLFLEKAGDNYVKRVSAHCSFEDLRSMFESDEWKIEVEGHGKAVFEDTPSKTQKKIARLNTDVFALID